MGIEVVEFSKAIITELEREQYNGRLEGVHRWFFRYNDGIGNDGVKVVDVKFPCTAESLAEIFDKLSVSLRKL
ncbi:MAG: hypothetical protein GY937_15360 [bacterium]|nr:hypothetical protein [bacterium]